MSHRNRNLLIFTLVALGGGFVGIGLDRLSPPPGPMQGLGALLWLVSPVVANLCLRAFGGDGWADFGFRPHFKTAWRWYLAGLAIPVGVTLFVLALGALLGVATLPGFQRAGLGAFAPVLAAGFLGAMAKNIFEEFAWRGYLTPRLEAIGTHPFVNSMLTGFIWAGWHIPYYLYYLDRAVLAEHTSLALPVFIALGFVVLPFHALAYGELRLLSKSVWPVWLLHTTANAISLPLFEEGFVRLNTGAAGVLLSPGTDGVIYSLAMGLIGLMLYRKRQRDAPLAKFPA